MKINIYHDILKKNYAISRLVIILRHRETFESSRYVRRNEISAFSLKIPLRFVHPQKMSAKIEIRKTTTMSDLYLNILKMKFGHQRSSEAVIFADPTHLTSIGITKHAKFDDPNRMTFISAIEFLKDHVLYKYTGRKICYLIIITSVYDLIMKNSFL